MDEEDPPLPRPDDRYPPDRHVRPRAATRIAAAVRDATVSNLFPLFFSLFLYRSCQLPFGQFGK